jgi:hypothetical protein
VPDPTPQSYVPPPPGPDYKDAARTLPFSGWWPVLGGALVGVLLRAGIFTGNPDGPYAAMMGSFIYLSPLLVGAVTVYLAETVKRRSWRYYVGASALANVLFVAGTLLILIEGWICAILIVPLFAAIGVVGGLIMGLVCRLTNWPTHAVYGLAVLPLVFGFVETGAPLPNRFVAVERSVVIDAPPEVVWHHIHYTPHIDTKEADAWIYKIGAPLPQTGITAQADQGRVRTVTMTKGVRFEQQVVEWEENRHARWLYRFDAHSFPPGSLDEHVVIGGHYFDMQEGEFTLTPRGDATELSMRIRYRLSTQFNWYASPLARALMGNLEETVLEFYRRHSESQTGDAA